MRDARDPSGEERQGAVDQVARGIVGGVTAGLALLAFEMLAAVALGDPAAAPLRSASAMLVGDRALSPAVPVWRVVAPGLLVHLALASAWGIGFVLVSRRLYKLARRRWAGLLVGGGFGLLVWGLEVKAGGLALPILAARESPVQLAGYVLAFGVVLGACLMRETPRRFDEHGL